MISGQLEEMDYLSAQSLYNTWSKRKQLLVLGGTALLLILGTLLLCTEHDISRTMGGGIIGGLIGGWSAGSVSRYLYVPWKARRTFRQQKNLHRPFEMSWDSEALTSQNANGSCNMPWSDYIRWKENESIFLLYHSDVIFQMVPKRAFTNAESIQEFRRLLQQKIATKPAS